MKDNNDKPADAREITREEFDSLCKAKAFEFGPWMQDWGATYGAPYIPVRQRSVWGRLKTGESVWAKGETL